MAPRRYSGESRVEQARLARQRIVTEAGRLFRANGYLGTTLAQVAHAAGISVQTIYNLVGGKDVLLKAVYDVAVAGDDEPVPVAQRPIVTAMIAADEAATVLTLYAQMTREIGERVLPLVSVVLAQAAAGDAQLADFADTIERERAMGTTATAHLLTTKFRLRAGLEESQAADVLWALTAPELADRLVNRRGWSWDSYQRWLAQTMTEALTEPI